MPVTPFHLGPAYLVKEGSPKNFSFRVFLLTQLIIDMEALYFIFTNQYPLHRFLHTFLGATCVVLFCIFIGRPLCILLTKPWNRVFQNVETFTLDPTISSRAAVIGAVFGSYTQVIFDAMMHTDVKPFAPFHSVNPFLHVVSHDALHQLCIYAGVLGFVIYSFRKRRGE